MLDHIQSLMSDLGYVGIVLLIFIENVFPPLPSEVIIPLAGFTASRGELSLTGVILAGTLGSVIGAVPLYLLGRLVSEARLARWADRYGKWLALNSKDVWQADAWFDRHGRKVVLFGRVVPGVRSLISVPAGLSGMHVVRFLLYTSLGSGVWTTALAVAGFTLGEHNQRVEQYLKPVSYVVLGALLVLGVQWVRQRHRPHTK